MLNKYAPVTSMVLNCTLESNFQFTATLYAFRSSVQKAENLQK